MCFKTAFGQDTFLEKSVKLCVINCSCWKTQQNIWHLRNSWAEAQGKMLSSTNKALGLIPKKRSGEKSGGFCSLHRHHHYLKQLSYGYSSEYLIRYSQVNPLTIMAQKHLSWNGREILVFHYPNNLSSKSTGQKRKLIFSYSKENS